MKTAQHEVRMVETAIPVPAEGEVVVRMTSSALCGTDMHILDESPLNPGMLPAGAPGLPMGHEAVGIVVAIGAGVRNLHEGQRVVASCLTACGRCPQCLEGQLSACSGGGSLLFGCQANYFRVPFADVGAAPIPDGLSDEQVLFAGDIMSTGLGAIERAELKFGDSVVVFGQGPVGLCATAGARARGAGLVIAVESVPERAEMARRLGANVVIDPTVGDPVSAILELTGPIGADIAVEAVGLQQTMDLATRVVRRGGTVSSVGVYGGLPGVMLPAGPASFYHRKIVFTLCPSGAARLQQLMRLVEFGGLDLTPLITHRMPLSQAPEAYELFRSRKALKIVLLPDTADAISAGRKG